MASKHSYVPGDLVLVQFPGCGYWPCQITAITKYGRREVKCFGEDSTGKAFPNCMVYYDENTQKNYISKASFKTYPHLAEALKQIKTCAHALNKTMENKNSKQKKNGNREESSLNVELVQIVEGSPPDVELPAEMVQGDSEGNSTEISCVGVSGSVGFIKNVALGEKELMQSVKMENASGVGGMENGSSQWGKAVKRETDKEASGEGIDVDETGTSNNDDELDYKIKVELDSEVDDFGGDENRNEHSSSSETINENSIATEASCEDDSSHGSEVNQPGLNVDLPSSSHKRGDQEKSNEVVKVTMTCEMPTHVFAKFAPIFMEAASHSKTPTVVKITPQ